MKKLLLIGTFVLVALVGISSLAFAQTPNPTTPQTPWGPGKGFGGMHPGGMWGQFDENQLSPMHDYMQAALAEALGLKIEDLQAAQAEGKTVWQLAEEKGFSVEDFQAVMLEARTSAIQSMVADGLLTQDQADRMLNGMHGMWGQGGSGGCPGMGGGYGKRWNNPNNPSTSNPTSNSL
jgi:hypothetical protein